MRSEPRRSRSALGTSCLAAATLMLASCGTEGPNLPTGEPPDGSVITASAESCALCYTHSFRGKGYDSAASKGHLAELAQQGYVAVSITNFGWMASATANEVTNGGSETPDAMRAAARDSAERSIDVMLKPHLWVRDDSWRGDIAPSDWDAWFDSYQRFIVAQAQLAEEIGASWFVVGLELKSAVAQNATRWREIISAVRAVYRGKVTYAANWDAVERVPFWDALDAVGIQMFAPLSAAGTASPPDQTALTEVAAGWLAKYRAVARAAGDKPLILTEAGFINNEGATSAPYVWPEQTRVAKTAAGDEEQRRGYQALLDTFGRSPDVAAIYWWKWFSDPDDMQEGAVGFWPRGKPVEQLLRDLCAKRAAARANR
ncbi:MAG: hypothetical protein KC503_32175 [Myxococcales bacterium]|nr:hypothetical protein [Myxococcales bacterium]